MKGQSLKPLLKKVVSLVDICKIQLVKTQDGEFHPLLVVRDDVGRQKIRG